MYIQRDIHKIILYMSYESYFELCNKNCGFSPISFSMCKNRLCYVFGGGIFTIPINGKKWLVVDRCTNNFIYISRIVAPTFKRFHSFPAIQDWSNFWWGGWLWRRRGFFLRIRSIWTWFNPNKYVTWSYPWYRTQIQ